VVRPVAEGAILTRDDVAPLPEGEALDLRRETEEMAG
jgi:predicted homoserine dehydrogenase-like protein